MPSRRLKSTINLNESLNKSILFSNNAYSIELKYCDFDLSNVGWFIIKSIISFSFWFIAFLNLEFIFFLLESSTNGTTLTSNDLNDKIFFAIVALE